MIVLVLLAAAALLAFIVIHLVWFIHPSRVESLDDLDHMLGSGQSIVIEFYSNLWTVCSLMKPVVDGLERRLNGRAPVIRLELLSPVGRAAARRYGIRLVPELIVVDPSGRVLLRQTGVFNPAEVINLITMPDRPAGQP